MTEYTQADLTSISRAIAAGRKKVQLGDRIVEYDTLDAMRRAKAEIEEELNKEAAALLGIRRPSAYRSRSNKGL